MGVLDGGEGRRGLGEDCFRRSAAHAIAKIQLLQWQGEKLSHKPESPEPQPPPPPKKNTATLTTTATQQRQRVVKRNFIHHETKNQRTQANT